MSGCSCCPGGALDTYSQDTAAAYLTGRAVLRRLVTLHGAAAGSTTGGVKRDWVDHAGHVGDLAFPDGIPCDVNPASPPRDNRAGGGRVEEVSTHEIAFPLSAPVKRGDRVASRAGSRGAFVGELVIVGVNEEETGRALAICRARLLEAAP